MQEPGNKYFHLLQILTETPFQIHLIPKFQERKSVAMITNRDGLQMEQMNF